MKEPMKLPELGSYIYPLKKNAHYAIVISNEGPKASLTESQAAEVIAIVQDRYPRMLEAGQAVERCWTEGGEVIDLDELRRAVVKLQAALSGAAQ